MARSRHVEARELQCRMDAGVSHKLNDWKVEDLRVRCNQSADFRIGLKAEDEPAICRATSNPIEYVLVIVRNAEKTASASVAAKPPIAIGRSGE